MKRVITLCCVLTLLTATASAQSFAFYQGDRLLEDNAEITIPNYSVYVEADEYMPVAILSIESELRLKNLTDNAISTSVSQTILDYQPSEDEEYLGYLSFCYNDCFTGNVDKTKTGMLSTGFDEGFHLNFCTREGYYTSIKVQYVVFAANDLSKTDKKTVTIHYVYDEKSMNGIYPIDSEQRIFASQEGNQVKFHYASDAGRLQLSVYSITGQKIAQHPLLSGNGTFTLPESLTKGIYIYTVENEKGATAAQKLIVK
jgi:hypothetical protein